MANIKPGDRILIAVGIALALACGIWFAVAGPSPAGSDLVVVCQTREGFRRVEPLSAEVTFTVESANGGENVVRIHNGTVDVERANCSNQVCVEHDPIAQAGEQIVCLPHGMVVEVVADERDAAELV